MARITGSIRIEAPSARVYDMVADSRNEPSFNPSMTDVMLLTPEPIGTGTRFVAHMGRNRRPMQVELTEYDRPNRLGSHTTSPMMETSGTLTFTPDGSATVMRWDWEVRPRGWLRHTGPLVGILGARMERSIWTALKRLLESGTSVPPA